MVKPTFCPVPSLLETQVSTLLMSTQNVLLLNVRYSEKPAAAVPRMKLMIVMIEYALTMRRLRMIEPTKLPCK